MFKCSKQEKIWIIFSIFLITVIFLLPQNSQASSLTTLSDKISRQAPLVAANHEIKFTTPSGIGDSGQYLRIIFDSGFNLAAINYTDIDLFHGPVSGLETEESLTGVTNLNSWGVNVSGGHIDFNHPLNNANGDIAPNDKVIVRLGLNASGASHQIINPATIGSKIITLSGNYGDSGKLAVAIFTDQIGVGGKTLHAPPNAVILNNPDNITIDSMDLSWSTNIDVDFDKYELYIGDNPGVTNLTGILIFTTTDHLLTYTTASSLASSRQYYFVLYVYNTEALFTLSNEVNAITLGGGVHIPPRPAMPTLDARLCPIFLSTTNLSGTKPLGTEIFINGSNENVNYPTLVTWEKLVNLILGNNLFLIFARDNYGQNSDVLNATVVRCEVGDTNCNGIVDDFDLAGLAYHWNTNWCYADFNEDGVVDDFDLSGLAAHWDGVY
ncbi:MAG: hypothetical protein NTX00_04390 [Candidatus Parcubacteria bacterium]|nr:hypothetical protein [Candidatus Parcubacteria bacterium]